MSFRIKPTELSIPIECPFQHDMLERQKLAEVLTRILEHIEGPCVLAVDAAWGSGKTTFLKMWAQWLRKLDFPVVAFNAWATDFTNQPFLALSAELTNELESYKEKSVASSFKKFKCAGTQVAKKIMPKIVASATGPAAPVAEAITNHIVTAFDGVDLDEYQKIKRIVEQFKEAFAELAGDLVEIRSDRPLVILIDELDRCRPSYAVELLEVAKHFFEEDHVIFVLAVNKSELVHSIQTLYGEKFDATGYLRRFIDLEFRLASPNREKFVAYLLESTGLGNCLSVSDQFSQNDVFVAKELMQLFLQTPELTLRDAEQAAHRLGLVFSGGIDASPPIAVYAVMAIILRTISPDLFYRFLAEQATDKDVADLVFSLECTKSLRRRNEGIEIECRIILSFLPERVDPRRVDENMSPLLYQYRMLSMGSAPNEFIESSDLEHAKMIVERMDSMVFHLHPSPTVRARSAFRESMQLLELLFSDPANS